MHQDRVPIRFFCFSSRGLEIHGSEKDLSPLLKAKENTIWIDAHKDTPGLKDLLEKQFGFHALSIEDCLGSLHRPKVEAYPQYLFLSIPHVIEDQHGKCCFQ